MLMVSVAVHSFHSIDLTLREVQSLRVQAKPLLSFNQYPTKPVESFLSNKIFPSQRYLSKGKRLANSAKGTKQSCKLQFSSSESDVRKRILGQGSSTVRDQSLILLVSQIFLIWKKTALKWMEHLGREAHRHNTVVDVLCAGTCPVRVPVLQPLDKA